MQSLSPRMSSHRRQQWWILPGIINQKQKQPRLVLLLFVHFIISCFRIYQKSNFKKSRQKNSKLQNACFIRFEINNKKKTGKSICLANISNANQKQLLLFNLVRYNYKVYTFMIIYYYVNMVQSWVSERRGSNIQNAHTTLHSIEWKTQTRFNSIYIKKKINITQLRIWKGSYDLFKRGHTQSSAHITVRKRNI